MLNGESSTPPVMCFRPGQADSTKRHSRLVEGVMNAAAVSLRLRGPDFEAAATYLARTSALGLAMMSKVISAKKLKPTGSRKASTYQYTEVPNSLWPGCLTLACVVTSTIGVSLLVGRAAITHTTASRRIIGVLRPWR